MSRIVGIDLGTTNSLVAAVDSGVPFVIADLDGHRLTPSVVHFPPPDRAPLVGRAANRVRVVQPARTVYSIKRFIGRRASEVSGEETGVTYPLNRGGAGPLTVAIGGRAWSPEAISAEILKKLRRDAEAYFGEPIERAVITVPAYFNDAQRNATKTAGELAGLNVERIINEPTAAALAYGLHKLQEHAKIAVYDLGGGTFDLSILELNGGVFQVLSTNGNPLLGGDDLDQRLVDFLREQILAAGGPDARQDLAILSRLREAAEETKIKLSAADEQDIALPFLTPGFSFSCRLTRAELEALTRDLVARTRPHCLRSLTDAKLEPNDLDQVILVGGQTRMPLVRRMVAEIFQCPEFEEVRGNLRVGAADHRPSGPPLNTSQNPDEAVALGAAIQAEILAGGFKDLLLLDITPLSLGIETFGGLMNVIIPRNTTIPVKAGELFTTAVDNQRDILVHVLQGERERAADNWTLGRFTLDFEPAPKGVPRVGVQFEINADGILQVLARDIKTGKQIVVKMKSAVDVDDTDVHRMIEESVEHAFDDLKTRQWIEARLRATETVAATRKGLAVYGGEIDAGYRAGIEEKLAAVEAALATENPQSNAGNVSQLKTALAALDEVTRALADFMMDKALEALLRKRAVFSDGAGARKAEDGESAP